MESTDIKASVGGTDITVSEKKFKMMQGVYNGKETRPPEDAFTVKEFANFAQIMPRTARERLLRKHIEGHLERTKWKGAYYYWEAEDDVSTMS